MGYTTKIKTVELQFEIGDIVFSNYYNDTGIIINKTTNYLSSGYNTQFLMHIQWDGKEGSGEYWPLESMFKIVNEKERLAIKLKYADKSRN